MTLKSLVAFGALLAATTASASVYAPSFAGPGLDPSLTFIGAPGMTYSVGGGTLGLYKAGGVTGAEGNVYSSFSTTGDFTATLTLSRGALGFVGLAFAAYDNSIGFPGSTYASPGTNVFSDGPNQFQSYVFGNFGAIASTDTLVTLKLTRSGNDFASFVDGTQVSSGSYAPVNPLTFMISLCAGTCISTPDPADRAAFITDFSVTTPDVPEPASWALMIAGFGLTGGSLRSRRLRIA
jgi:hypothetical protein